MYCAIYAKEYHLCRHVGASEQVLSQYTDRCCPGAWVALQVAPVKTSSLAVELTEEEKIILEYNQRIAVFNRAPSDYPSFIRNGRYHTANPLPPFPLPLSLKYGSTAQGPLFSGAHAYFVSC